MGSFTAGFAIFAILIARSIGVGIPISMIRLNRKPPKFTIRVLTWSGLRGGISVALALSLYDVIESRIVDMIIALTYSIVVFSIIVQGLTFSRLLKAVSKEDRIK